jgi:hypothetical protein
MQAILKLLSNDDFPNLHPNADEEDGTIGNAHASLILHIKNGRALTNAAPLSVEIEQPN